jgi:signal transduction histidine kinase
VIAVPFFLEGEVVGNLFAATSDKAFSEREIEILTTFGQQAAVGIRNAQLYRKSEERREVALIFAKMAFSAAASVHALRNHVGAFRMYSQLVGPQLSSEALRDLGVDVAERLNRASGILDNLHEPWRGEPDGPTDINKCLQRALDKVVPNREAFQKTEKILISESLSETELMITTSSDMLTEAFRILMKNGLEAIRERISEQGKDGNLWIESRQGNDGTMEVVIRDDGIGILPEDSSKIFEMKFSTKEVGMGFGLFWTKDYVEGLGGAITVESVWQEGTTFQISLPQSLEPPKI